MKKKPVRAPDFDDFVESAQEVPPEDRSRLLGHAFDLLAVLEKETVRRLEILLFVQALLAAAGEREIESKVADDGARQLSDVVVSPSDPIELKRSALDGLALLFLKAKALTRARINEITRAFQVASRVPDRYLSAFAAGALAPNGLLSRRNAEYNIAIMAFMAGGLRPELPAGVFQVKNKTRVRRPVVKSPGKKFGFVAALKALGLSTHASTKPVAGAPVVNTRQRQTSTAKSARQAGVFKSANAGTSKKSEKGS